MLRMTAWRLAQFPLILAIIYLITFMFVWVVPGDPFTRSERELDPVAKEALMRRFHAEKWYSFLGYYPRRIFTAGDFGPSMHYPEWSVNDIIREALPVSIELGLFALVVGLVFGLMVGTTAAVRR